MEYVIKNYNIIKLIKINDLMVDLTVQSNLTLMLMLMLMLILMLMSLEYIFNTS
jgi:hypothetical protein